MSGGFQSRSRPTEPTLGPVERRDLPFACWASSYTQHAKKKKKKIRRETGWKNLSFIYEGIKGEEEEKKKEDELLLL